MPPDDQHFKRIHPCLLDRLLDDNSASKVEGRNARVISSQAYREGVLRDLTWLFSTSAHLPVEGSRPGTEFRIGDFPEVERSVFNFGIRHLFGLTAPDMGALEDSLYDAICVFEPRIIKSTLSVRATMLNQLVSFEIRGDLWANPIPEKLFIKTQVDIEAGAGQAISSFSAR
ncbi:type VI secretion system protein ImpF [Ereboglobus sp. PH5-10]|uniref:type VI secretion system baseplate subunit TssE n=1 Tax=Ereboglobus sp. PH5-10 TaxID=2940629 RepID=UPI002406EF75|nr:GPW/gp25 family protein [Ereboglobus sp. PH5-10]MDF9826556.1 type VI secretion system protein ImpF [Ereboglobus sp. PH5-10]